MGIVLNNGIEVADYGRPYFIAEVNSSHNGNVEAAKQMVDAAVDAGCDCVKFQSWSVRSLYSRTYYKENPIAERFVRKLSLAPEQLKEMAKYCAMKGISFSSTPYSREEADFLVDECQAPFVKISSMEINNPEFLRYIGEKQIPVILSTGMAEMKEVESAVRALEGTGNRNIILLHCVSVYPAKTESINLNNILGLRERFPNYPVGFSDHTLGGSAAIAATALGAAVIEKHITLDAKKIGMDNQMAMEPEALKNMVKACRNICLALGAKERIVLEEEYAQRKNMRRSIVATRDLAAGETLCREDLDVKRPGTGLAPDRLTELIGCTVIRDIEADTVINESDFMYSQKGGNENEQF